MARGGRRAMHRKGVAAVAAVFALAALPAGAHAKTTWLCRPGLANDPCTPDLTTTRISAAGTVLGTDGPRPAARPKVDCFYVYPTISDQPTVNANLNVDPVERSSALYQAARYSQYCRVFAPMYPQLTVRGLLTASPAAQVAAEKVAYRGVLSAWRDYLAHDNHGRGVIFIGHSQGTFMLVRLIRDQIDRRPALRKRLVSAILLGGNVVVRKGSDRGGDFKNVRACRRRSQVGCTIAFSTFDQPVPSGTLFGRIGSATASLSESPKKGPYRVLCTNPASLHGGAGTISPISPTTPYAPGTIATALALMGLPAFPVSTPFIDFANAYRAQCSSRGGANVLQIRGLGSAPKPKPTPTPEWGLHFTDASIALGNLLDVDRSEIGVYERAPASG